jgi:hypothetical protein
MTKKSGGMFFEKMARPSDGNFFRDMGGRDDATFHQKTAMTDAGPKPAEPIALPQAQSNMSADPMVGASKGNMFGSGKGLDKNEGDAKRLARLLGNAKTAAADPTDWEGGQDVPTGFHRPTKEQPRALEDGGTRFQSSDTDGAVLDGLVEGGTMRMRQGTGHQMGKHASASTQRFMGTSYGLNKTAEKDMKYDPEYRAKAEEAAKKSGNYLGNLGSKTGKSGQKFVGKIGETVDKTLQSAAGSPAAVGIGGIMAAILAKRGLGRVAKGAARLAGGKAVAKPGLLTKVKKYLG